MQYIVESEGSTWTIEDPLLTRLTWRDVHEAALVGLPEGATVSSSFGMSELEQTDVHHAPSLRQDVWELRRWLSELATEERLLEERKVKALARIVRAHYNLLGKGDLTEEERAEIIAEDDKARIILAGLKGEPVRQRRPV